ncbi:prolyl oligopeptidase family serine peptidase [Kordia algicida OT-1]|uniref:Prolyl oligopeptidase family protein n=1 Tax=Kordia algicida OT-1 TaxID=391587 RepID=A9EDQ4_9FLAO|nr:prolyl oligopeptidase family serine peptidase [Kordia algicida]EDP94209.1 prolyl oligopeptidase family protein [Kordia algicida OT-1]
MNKTLLSIILIILISCATEESFQRTIPTYLKSNTSDIYHGKEVKDTFRPLENMKDSLILHWYKNEAAYAQNILQNISGRELFQAETNAAHVEISQFTFTNNDHYYYLKKDASETVAKLYCRYKIEGEEILIFDPETYKNQSENNYYINYFNPSWNNAKIVISLSKDDQEISELIVLDAKTKKKYPQVITNAWPAALGGIRWLADDSGFFYEHIPHTNSDDENYLKNIQTVLYKIGSNPKRLNVYFSKENNPEINMNSGDFPEVILQNQSDKYLFSNVSGASAYYEYYYTAYDNLYNKKITWKPLFKQEDKIPFFSVDQDDLYFITAREASNFKICKTSLKNPDVRNPEILVAEDPKATISDFVITKQGLFFVKTKNGVSSKLYRLQSGEIEEIPIPKPAGAIYLLSKGADFDDLWIEISGWTTNEVRYKYNSEENTFTEESLYPEKTNTNYDNIVVEELEVPSHDGTLIPLSLIYHKDIQKNGNNHVLMRGYGTYAFSLTPEVDAMMMQWIDKGGIYAVTHVRGGGEKGDTWHKAGFKKTKPNTWKDFIACTEYLIEQKYTNASKIAAWSSSAGGILIGRAITERPDLYAAAIIRVGKLNTLRSENTPNGLNGIKEYGTVKDAKEFEYLLEMDAYHHVEDNEKYPALLLTAGMNDTRVPAWQPGKFAARMIQASNSNKPILFNVNFNSGHGFDASTEKRQTELQDILSFAFWQTGHEKFTLKKETQP